MRGTQRNTRVRDRDGRVWDVSTNVEGSTVAFAVDTRHQVDFGYTDRHDDAAQFMRTYNVNPHADEYVRESLPPSALDGILSEMRKAVAAEDPGTTVPVPVRDLAVLLAEIDRR